MKEDLKIYKMENPEHLQKPWHRLRSLTRALNSKTPPAKTLCLIHQGDTMHSMIYAFLMIMWSGSPASTAHTWSPDTCTHARQQVNRIKHVFTTESFTPTPSTSRVISTEKGSRKSKCEVLQELLDYYNCNCTEAFQKDGDKIIRSETKGLIYNLQMLKRSKDEKQCNLSDPSRSSKIQHLSSWEKYIYFQRLIRECLQIIQHVCP